MTPAPAKAIHSSMKGANLQRAHLGTTREPRANPHAALLLELLLGKDAHHYFWIDWCRGTQAYSLARCIKTERMRKQYLQGSVSNLLKVLLLC